jgi:hypothetical protein
MWLKSIVESLYVTGRYVVEIDIWDSLRHRSSCGWNRYLSLFTSQIVMWLKSIFESLYVTDRYVVEIDIWVSLRRRSWCGSRGQTLLKESYFWTLSIVQCFLKNTTLRKVDLFPSSGKIKVAPTLLVPLEKLASIQWSKQIQFPKRCVFEKTLDDGQSPKSWFFHVQYTIVRTL